MFKKKSELYKIIGVFILFYMFFVVGKTSYQNYQIDKKIKKLKTELETLEKDNEKLAGDIEYYKTDEYKEKVARQRLGLKKPGEKVIVIVPSKENKNGKEKKKELSNPRKWWKKIFELKEN